MKAFHAKSTGLLAATFCLFALSGCNLPIEPPQADPVRHFTLSGPVTVQPAGGPKVAQVQLAGHLRPREFAVRVGENEVVYLEDARWAEPLGDGLTALLRARLANVAAAGTVTVQVQRCEPVRGAGGHTVEFSATYNFQPTGPGPARTGSFNAAARPWDGKDPAALAGLLRTAAGELGDAIAATAEAK